MTPRTERNLVLYRWHTRATGSLFWLPTVFLYFIDEVGLTRTLQLQAVYYAAVVVCEVPSGWFSDQVGRTTTLRITAIAWLGAFTCLLVGGLGPILAGQVLLAVGYASLSGTDVTFLFDTLDGAGRAGDFEAEESNARRGSLLITATTAVSGGLLGVVDLRLPFVAALIVAGAQLALVLQMDEPPRGAAPPAGWRADAAAVVGHLRSAALAWVTVYVVAEVVLIHLAGELAAPYVAFVLERPSDDPAGAAVIAGLLTAGGALVGAACLVVLRPLRHRLGTVGVLVWSGGVSVAVITAMATIEAVWLLPFLALRGVQIAVTTVVVPALVGRRVEANRRATTLSTMSLLGRGTYAAVLLGIAAAVGDVLPDVLDTAALIAIVTLALLVATSWIGPVRRELHGA